MATLGPLHYPLAAVILVFGCSAAGMAQDVTKPALPQTPIGWQPRDGIYAYRDADVDALCKDFGELSIDLAKRRIMGHEITCRVTNRTHQAPDTLRIGLLCGDYNLAAHLKMPDEREFKEVMLLRKIDEATISVQKTVNGKFADPPAPAVYCPDEAQRRYRQMLRREQEAKRAEAIARKRYAKWVPTDGIYVSQGSGFADRCSKREGLVLGLSNSSVAVAGNECSIFIRNNSTPGEISLEMICNGRTGSKFLNLRRIDDSTLELRGRNELTKADGIVGYCGEEVQRAYRDQRAGG